MADKADSASKSLIKSGAVVSSLTFVSRIFGFLRDQLMAISFGAGGLMDAFYLAFALPNFLRRIFAEGAFSQAFVPVFNETKQTRSAADLRLLCAHVSGTLSVVVFVLALLGVLFAEPLINVVAHGLSATPERQAAAVTMLRWTFPYLAFIALVAYAGGVLNSEGRFSIPAVTPVFLNICLISAIFLSGYYPGPGEYALAIGVFVAGVVQLLFQLPYLQKLGLLPMPKLNFKDKEVRKILALMGPAVLGASVAQVNLLFDKFIASFLADGSFSWLYNADRLVEFPLGVFGVALATVVLPTLSRQSSSGDEAARESTFLWGCQIALLIAVPSMVGLFVLAEPLFWVLFTYGRFLPFDASQAAVALSGYALALPAFVLLKIQTSVFFAAQDTKTPVKIGMVSIVANMAFNVIAVLSLRKLAPGIEHAGLAYATAASSWLNCIMLQVALKRCLPKRNAIPGRAGFVLKTLCAGLVMGVVLFLVAEQPHWLDFGPLARILSMIMLIAGGAFLYAVSLYVLGLRPRQFNR